MYQPLDYLEVPNDEEKIWRYLDLAKFVSLLDEEAIYFPSLDKLASGDSFEGLLPNFNTTNHSILSSFSGEIEQVRKLTKNYRKHFYASCWHLNNVESYAMWQIYGNNQPAVAIQTNFASLKNVFKNRCEEIFVGKVKYDDDIRITTRILTCFFKRKAFEFEQELRIAFEKLPTNSNNEIDYTLEPERDGYSIDVDLNILIKGIIVSPTAPSYFYDVVKSLVTKYNLPGSIIIQNSALATKPQ